MAGQLSSSMTISIFIFWFVFLHVSALFLDLNLMVKKSLPLFQDSSDKRISSLLLFKSKKHFSRNYSANFFKYLIGHNWITYTPLKTNNGKETRIYLIGIDSSKVMP